MSTNSCEQWTNERLDAEIDILTKTMYRVVKRRNYLVGLWNERCPPPPPTAAIATAWVWLTAGLLVVVLAGSALHWIGII